MSSKYNKDQELICIKQMVLDEDQYGIDCLINQAYRITGIECDGYYIETESGSEVFLTENEIPEYFKVA